MLRSNLLKRVIANQVGGLVLDNYTAFAAYSLVYLGSSYSGPVIRVELIGGSQQNFTPTEITDGTLDSFLGSGNGFVNTIFDQSGNGYDFTQSNIADMPIIGDSGVIETSGGLPCLNFRSADTLDTVTKASVFDGNFSAFSVYESQSSSDLGAVFSEIQNDSAFEGVALFSTTTSDKRNYQERISSTNYGRINDLSQLATNTRTVFDVHRSGSDLISYRDNVEQGTDTTTASFSANTFFRIGARGGIQNPWNGKWQETIIFNTNQEANRADIISNRNDYYGVY